jgi:F-type H+-transporting ATPase subunit b
LNIFPDASVLVTFALVWILVLVLSKVFFKPVSRIVGERTAGIEQAKAETEKTLAAYEEDLRRIEEKLKDARAVSEEIWEQAENHALGERTRLIQELQVETRAQVEKAKQELEREVEELKRKLDARSVEFSEDIERRILN